ncbi:DNA-3-methyladenine glycosylase family protein [Frigoriglobus tundricola]|uniref:DNA-3-methyladenine glycosylase II n=1 Tax=Frigoriglobus tundricola TaxID=2774151 RepID=A0A6M5YKX7_9BACT|nr:DNA-3-methyladenine glycosylase 2 family protein [Frigoriglobus tundricola]QJW93936.1 DNA-3-methyladenine glycosylase II [Frigoriglobus tundricola]
MNAATTDRTAHVQSARDIEAVRVELSGRDPALAVAHAAAGPFEWHVRESGFAGLVRLITEQQVSTASAAAIWKRFAAGVGSVTANNLKAFDVDTLKTFGLSRPKAVYVRAVADAEAAGAIDFTRLPELSDEEAIAQLTALKGVGRWTAEVYLMFCEGRTDLFPAGDLALQEGFRLAARARARPSEKDLYARAERWRPYRGVAANLLWSYYRDVKSGEIVVPAVEQAAPGRQPPKRPRPRG